jgi:hypothetical protein
VAILENWLEHIERGHWQVNEKGVMGGIDGKSTRIGKSSVHKLKKFAVWKEADTRQNWWRYQGKHLLI